jgi:hypothetical protein
MVLEGVGRDYVTQGAMGMCWWGFHLSCIMRKEVGCVGEVDLWAPSSFAYPHL